jgi:hypothetical protein
MKSNKLQELNSISLVDAEGKIIETINVDDPENVTICILVRNDGEDDDLAISTNSPIDMIVMADNLVNKASKITGASKKLILKTMLQG